MTAMVPRTEEKEWNWADLLDGLRYDGFRRSVSAGLAKPDTSTAGASDDEARTGGEIRKPADSAPD